MKKIILLLSLSLFLFASCEKEDYREVYVGNWSGSVVGAINLMYNGQVAGTSPVDQYGNIHIDMGAGENEITIDGMDVQISGTKLIFDTQTTTESGSGITMQLTTTRSGQISNTLMSFKETYSGTWQGNNVSGIITGSSNATFSKK